MIWKGLKKETTALLKRNLSKMEFPKQYIERGNFRLHSGGITKVFYDVNALLCDPEYLNIIIENVPRAGHYVGVATGGAVIAGLVPRTYAAGFSMVNDGKLKGNMP